MIWNAHGVVKRGLNEVNSWKMTREFCRVVNALFFHQVVPFRLSGKNLKQNTQKDDRPSFCTTKYTFFFNRHKKCKPLLEKSARTKSGKRTTCRFQIQTFHAWAAIWRVQWHMRARVVFHGSGYKFYCIAIFFWVDARMRRTIQAKSWNERITLTCCANSRIISM